MSKENKKIPDLSQEVYIELLNEIYTKTLEERDLSLDRYRFQDEQMQNPDDFILQGKNAISFLNHASTRTDALFNISKEMKSIIFKDNGANDGANSGAAMSDEKRRALADFLKNAQQAKEDNEEIEHDEDLINNIDTDDIEDKDEE